MSASPPDAMPGRARSGVLLLFCDDDAARLRRRHFRPLARVVRRRPVARDRSAPAPTRERGDAAPVRPRRRVGYPARPATSTRNGRACALPRQAYVDSGGWAAEYLYAHEGVASRGAPGTPAGRSATPATSRSGTTLCSRPARRVLPAAGPATGSGWRGATAGAALHGPSTGSCRTCSPTRSAANLRQLFAGLVAGLREPCGRRRRLRWRTVAPHDGLFSRPPQPSSTLRYESHRTARRPRPAGPAVTAVLELLARRLTTCPLSCWHPPVPHRTRAGGARRPAGARGHRSPARRGRRPHHALQLLLPADSVVDYPAWDTPPHERLSPRAAGTLARRLAVLCRLRHPRADDAASGPVSVVVAPVRSPLQPHIPSGRPRTDGAGGLATRWTSTTSYAGWPGSPTPGSTWWSAAAQLLSRGGILDVSLPTGQAPTAGGVWADTGSKRGAVVQGRRLAQPRQSLSTACGRRPVARSC